MGWWAEGGGGGGGGGERWDKSSLWMDLFSLDSILVIVTCNCLPFSYSRWFFSDTYLVRSAENNVLDPHKRPTYGPEVKYVLQFLD